ncbi:4-hydroxy-tetrahydrodipicolinate reductase [Spirochaetia bacterium]|nr:4-hydroxy-tetrahydrodipicolinate reductase [Spirochaetia bacterium]
MNILIAGYGKMGRIIETLAIERGHRIAAAVDPFYIEEKTASFAPVFKTIADLDRAGGAAALSIDVAVEFTRPDTAAANIKALAERRIPVVVGTTGWLDLLDEVSAVVNKAGSSLLWASNFSLGVNLFYRIAEFAAKLADPFPEYDVGGFEVHHNKKVDGPSGTAKTLAEKVLAQMKRKKIAVYDKLDRPPAPDELHYASLRVGSVPGIHTLTFDSPADTIEITHTARGREGLASGALTAAQWLVDSPGGKVRQGVFTMDDVLESIL